MHVPVVEAITNSGDNCFWPTSHRAGYIRQTAMLHTNNDYAIQNVNELFLCFIFTELTQAKRPTLRFRQNSAYINHIKKQNLLTMLVWMYAQNH